MTQELSQGPWPDEVVWRSKFAGQEQEDYSNHSELMFARQEGIGRFGSHRYEGAMAEIRGRLDRRFPDIQYSPKHAYLGAVASTTGALIEVGGPTERYDDPLVLATELENKLTRKVHVLNIDAYYKPDIVADAWQLPFADESAGLVVASCLPIEARSGFFKEAMRVLENGGVLAYQRGSDLDFSHTLARGFQPIAYSRMPREDIGEEFTVYDRAWTFASRKP